MSQAHLARELEHRGFSFTQQTLVRVEKGVQPLKFEEAIAVAETLGIDAAALHELTESRAATLSMRLQAANAEIARRQRAIAVLEAEIEPYQEAIHEAERELVEECGAIRDIAGRLFWLLPRPGKGDVIMPADGGPLSDDPDAISALLRRSIVANAGTSAETATEGARR
jgi:hypothetical protein